MPAPGERFANSGNSVFLYRVRPKIQGLIYDERLCSYKIRELEISITSKCHLRCSNCGFYVPDQPDPAASENIVDEISINLLRLQKLGIKIGSLGILGGEPAFNKDLLGKALREFSRFENINQLEVITHGLVPQNIPRDSLDLIDKLSISVYFDSPELLELWKTYIDMFAPSVELCLRQDEDWDQWIGEKQVSDSKAQEMFDICWYRKHCVTLERQRLFLCSRIAKRSDDAYGIFLSDETTLEEIKNYLNKDVFISSCKNCTPMMGLPSVKAGMQPDDRINKLLPAAINFLKTAIGGKA
jgi:organic radical activating enzyme